MADKNLGSGEVTLISASTVVEGTVKTDGSIRIDGKHIGDILAKANAAVGQTGIVEGDVSARNMTVAGRVAGTVTASEKLTLEAKSVVQGDIRATKLVVEEGATFDGHCAMAPNKQGGMHVEGAKEGTHRRP